MKKLVTLFLLSFFTFAQASVVLAAESEKKTELEERADAALDASEDADAKAEADAAATAAAISAEAKKDKIDLYAPFAAKGKDIFCKTAAPICDAAFKKSHIGDGCYIYSLASSAQACQDAGGIIVQRLVSESNGKTGMTESILQHYVSMVFVYGLGLGVSFAILMIVVGGIEIIASAGSPDVLSKGKDKIVNGILGLALLLLAGVLLHTINPLFFTLT